MMWIVDIFTFITSHHLSFLILTVISRIFSHKGDVVPVLSFFMGDKVSAFFSGTIFHDYYNSYFEHSQLLRKKCEEWDILKRMVGCNEFPFADCSESQLWGHYSKKIITVFFPIS